METPSFKEDHISQIPALQLLQNVGYTYLSQDEALSLRCVKTSVVLLEKILRDHLRKQTFTYRERIYPYSEESINRATQALKDVPMNEGYMAASARVYDLLTQGIAVEETIAGDKKSYTLQFIDWKENNNNFFHVSEEY